MQNASTTEGPVSGMQEATRSLNEDLTILLTKQERRLTQIENDGDERLCIDGRVVDDAEARVAYPAEFAAYIIDRLFDEIVAFNNSRWLLTPYEVWAALEALTPIDALPSLENVREACINPVDAPSVVAGEDLYSDVAILRSTDREKAKRQAVLREARSLVLSAIVKGPPALRPEVGSNGTSFLIMRRSK